MDAAAIRKYIVETFAHIQIANDGDNSFFFYGPDGKIPEKTFPFATLVTDDKYDKVSNMSRGGVCRLNVGISKETFVSLLGQPPRPPGESGIIDTGHDFTAVDEIMPHPIYGHLMWICALNPADKSWKTVQSLLAEAYESAVKKQTKAK
jgi:hypothetical protein